MIDTILLDMDGVVADFFGPAILKHIEAAERKFGVRTLADLDGKLPPDCWNIPELLGLTAGEFWAPVDNYEFWSGLPCFEGAREFVARVAYELAPVVFCTKPAMNPDGVKAKVEWIHRNIGPQYPIHLVYNGDKKILARPGLLLVDDFDRNIREYREHGGPAISVPRPWSTAEANGAIVSHLSVDYEYLHKRIGVEIYDTSDAK